MLAIFCAGAFFTSCNSCNEKHDSGDETASSESVDPKFEMLPPIASDVFIQKAEGDAGFVLVTAKFPPNAVKSAFLAVNVGDEKVVLRDDGKGGDLKKGDLEFTAKVKDDSQELEASFLESNKRLKQPLLEFEGRAVVGMLKDRRPLDIESFRAGKKIKLPPFVLPGAPELKDHSLMVTNLGVVEDPTRTWNSCTKTGNVDGAWTFKTLMKNLASTTPGALVDDVALSDFTENWLLNWATTKVVNGETVAARTNMNTVLATWRTASQSATLPLPHVPAGKLDMRAAPFRLLAIVNRLDLRGNSGYGFSNAGEGRFVFCMMNNCAAREFNIIFEYGIPKKSCAAVKAYARQWYDLKDMAIGSEPYNLALQAITDQFTKCGTSPSKPNQSSLNQLRTNEIAMGSPWQLREFTLDAATHQFNEVTVQQEPAVIYNAKLNNADVQRLVRYINANAADILATRHEVPLAFEATPFRGGKSHTQAPPAGTPSGTSPHHWNGMGSATPASFITDDNVRQNFSLNTCSGCHGGETQTSFTMIDPKPFGVEATMAGFLTGTPGRTLAGTPIDLDGPNGIMFVPDPAGRPSADSRRKFADLQRRANDLETLVNTNCAGVRVLVERLRFKPLHMTH